MCVCLVDKLCEGQQQQTHTLRHLRDSVLCWLRIWRMCRGHRVCLSDLLTSTAGDSAILSLSTRPTAGHPAGVSARLSCSKYHRGRRMRGVWGMCSGQGCAGRNESQGVVLLHSLSLFERAKSVSLKSSDYSYLFPCMWEMPLNKLHLKLRPVGSIFSN